MKNRSRFFCYLPLSLLFILGSCFSPLDYVPPGRNSGIRVALGEKTSSGPARSLISESDFVYTVSFAGPEGRVITRSASWGETVQVDAAPGNWNVSIKAFSPNDLNTVKAMGETYNVEVKRGEISNASIKMAIQTAVNTGWASLKAAIEQGTYDEVIELTDDIMVYSSDSPITLSAEKTITLIVNSDIYIDIGSGYTGSLFNVEGGGHLILGSAFSESSIMINGNSSEPIVFVSSSGTFTMNNAEISGNATIHGISGGAVYNEGAFTMNSGSLVTGNSSTFDGGGVYNAGIFVMNGGEISGNSAPGPESMGGGVFNAGTFTMNGGTIAGNSDTWGGDGVYNSGEFEMSQDAYVREDNAVYLDKGKTLTVNKALSRPTAAVITFDDYLMPGTQILSGTAVSAMKGKFTISAPVEMLLDDNGKLTRWNTVSFAGDGTAGLIDGPVDLSQFSFPAGIAAGADGTLYIADTGNHCVRKISPDGIVSTLAGGMMGFADGVGQRARFRDPRGIAVDADGNVYIADTGNHLIRKVSPDGTVSTLAGEGMPGSADGSEDSAQFNSPEGVAVDAGGNVYVADTGNSLIRKIMPDGTVSTLADDSGLLWGSSPKGIAVHADGNIYVTDNNGLILKLSPYDGIWNVTTLAGSDGFYGEEEPLVDGLGDEARFSEPSGIAVDSDGTVYVADTGNNAIRKITPAGYVTTIAGEVGPDGDGGWVDGFYPLFYQPTGIVVGSGAIYVADTGNSAIRKITMP